MKKGFTLIELLAIIVVFSIILLIGTASVTMLIKENRKQMYDDQVASFKSSVELWIYDNMDLLPLSGDSIKLTYTDLVDAGVLAPNIKNPLTDESFNSTLYFCIFNNNGNYSVVYNGTC